MMTDTGVEVDAWGYLIVCVPVVVVFAPLGSLIASHFHRYKIFATHIFGFSPLHFRQVLAALVYILDALALVGFCSF